MTQPEPACMHKVLGPCTLIRVQSWSVSEAVPPREEQVLRGWPLKMGTVASGSADVLCIGPAEWLVIAADPDHLPLLDRLEDAFQGSSFRATNVSSSLVRLRIENQSVRDLLAKG